MAEKVQVTAGFEVRQGDPVVRSARVSTEPTYSGRPGNTATRRKAIARDARRHGHFRPSQGLAYVYCPRCGKRVDADVVTGQTVAQALDAFMVFHLEDCLDYPEVTR